MTTSHWRLVPHGGTTSWLWSNMCWVPSCIHACINTWPTREVGVSLPTRSHRGPLVPHHTSDSPYYQVTAPTTKWQPLLPSDSPYYQVTAPTTRWQPLLPSESETPDLAASLPQKKTKPLSPPDRPTFPTPLSNATSSVSTLVQSYFAEPCLEETHFRLGRIEVETTPSSQHWQIPSCACFIFIFIERRFSIAGKIFRPERCSLSDERFEQLIFVRTNKDIV